MTHWKDRLSRLTLSTVSLLIFTGVGGFLGGLAGGLVALMGLALFEATLPVMALIAVCIVVGMAVAFLWALRLVVENARPQVRAPQKHTGDTKPIPIGH